ncbi:MAG: sugar-binding domain-containing protein [Acidobacteriaceae bacterium]
MPISRRDFLEVSALSASSLLPTEVPSWMTGEAAVIPQGNAPTSDGQRRMPEARLVLSMNQDWQFFRPLAATAQASQTAPGNPDTPPENVKWEPATLPHAVRLEPLDVSGGRNYQGVCWYQRSFSAQPDWKGRIVYLKFQGAMQVVDVWLNGVHQTTHYGGYIPFMIDI